MLNHDAGWLKSEIFFHFHLLTHSLILIKNRQWWRQHSIISCIAQEMFKRNNSRPKNFADEFDWLLSLKKHGNMVV